MTVGDASSPLVTQEILRAEFAAFRAESAKFRAQLRAERAAFRAQLRADTKEWRAQLYRGMVIQSVVFAGIVAAIVALLTRL